MDYKFARSNMVQQQVRTWDVLDTEVLAVLDKLPRERFVPGPYKSLAYSDAALPLEHNQVILPPKMIGKILQNLRLSKKDTVLELCTNTGYLTAALGLLAKKVITYTIFKDFSITAAENLRSLDIQNVVFKIGDYFQELEASATIETFDAIVLTGSLSFLPQKLPKALSIKGRLFAVVGEAPSMSAMLLTRVNKDLWVKNSLFETVIDRLPFAPQEEQFKF